MTAWPSIYMVWLDARRVHVVWRVSDVDTGAGVVDVLLLVCAGTPMELWFIRGALLGGYESCPLSCCTAARKKRNGLI